MATTAFSVTPCVRILIDDPEARTAPDFQQRVICRLLKWMQEQRILPVRGTSGGSSWFHYGDYFPEDAERIAAWLREQGTEEQAP